MIETQFDVGFYAVCRGVTLRLREIHHLQLVAALGLCAIKPYPQIMHQTGAFISSQI